LLAIDRCIDVRVEHGYAFKPCVMQAASPGYSTSGTPTRGARSCRFERAAHVSKLRARFFCWALHLREHTRRLILASKTSNLSAGLRSWATRTPERCPVPAKTPGSESLTFEPESEGQPRRNTSPRATTYEASKEMTDRRGLVTRKHKPRGQDLRSFATTYFGDRRWRPIARGNEDENPRRT